MTDFGGKKPSAELILGPLLFDLSVCHTLRFKGTLEVLSVIYVDENVGV